MFIVRDLRAGGDDVMLYYQSLSFHDALYARQVLGLAPAPEFAAWLERMELMTGDGRIREPGADSSALRALTAGVR
ncbi:ethanolamine ammonia-lyase subunit EutB [Pseudonocardia halophobica]|uniref:ethanolamine ammonia-lyase subunit EutB n=1 Tax=Pseudonocardia halophobica TaxID=29401 RepID=UPI003D8BF0D8